MAINDAGMFTVKEINRLKILQDVIDRNIRPGQAAEMLGITPRHCSRLLKRYRQYGPLGMNNQSRGRTGNRLLPASLTDQALSIIREHYRDFGPTLAREKLEEVHGLVLGKETIRRLMIKAGLWIPRRQRAPKIHQPRYRRPCTGELIQINTEKCLDFIEICFQILVSHVAKNHYEFKDITSQSPGDAVIELNERFREHGVGYQFESEEIIRIDSQLIHADVVKPTLILLSGEPLFEGANDEFLAAHEHYRHKRYKECLNDCLKSFESIMKAIHDKNNWKYSPNDTASKLINSCLSQNLIPAYLQSQFTSLKTMLETGIPTIRNKNAGHGQGADIKEVPEELVSYMLHLTATNLLFLLKCEKNIK
ncbi:TPA: helix-turn-helix domain containing protein [Escherichia coli]|nr:helix-turn-helix domain containing protein [Escherichia coli]